MEIAGAIVLLVGGIWGLNAYVDSRIENKLRSEETVRRVAALVRPSCIFDEHGRILFDSGAMQSIEAIEIELPPKGTTEWMKYLPRKIVVKMNRHTAYAPLLTVVDSYAAEIKTERGLKFDWVFTLEYGSAVATEPYDKCRFRVEIL